MTAAVVGLAVVLVLLLSGALVSWSATRLDRLHARVEAARAALDAQLYHRSGVALEVAASGLLDPASAVLVASAARAARAAPEEEREAAESDLTGALAAAFGEPDAVAAYRSRPGADVLLGELADACHRVELARRFHNDVVASTTQLRTRLLVRWFRLAGRAAMPTTVEFDDRPPPAFAAPSAGPGGPRPLP